MHSKLHNAQESLEASIHMFNWSYNFTNSSGKMFVFFSFGAFRQKISLILKEGELFMTAETK